MDRSAYLAQAIQAMQQGTPAPTAPQGLSPQQMAQAVQQRQAWEAANPGQSYMAHGLQQLGQNFQNAPSAILQGARNLGSLPGDIGGAFGRVPPG